MQHLWFSNLPKAEQEDRKKFVLSNAKVLDILAQIVYNVSIVESKPSSKDYDSPNWAYKQAHQNGKVEAFNEVLRLLKVSDQET